MSNRPEKGFKKFNKAFFQIIYLYDYFFNKYFCPIFFADETLPDYFLGKSEFDIRKVKIKCSIKVYIV